MNEPNIGHLINKDDPHPIQRDAIHIAILQVEAYEPLFAGQPVRFILGRNDLVKSSNNPELVVGVVDPFLNKPDTWKQIDVGEKFWLFLKPKTITSLSHKWSHPIVDAVAPTYINGSHKYLSEFADSLDKTYEELIQGLQDVAMNESLIHLGFDTPDYNPDAIWDAFEVMTQIKMPKHRREEGIFSCSC